MSGGHVAQRLRWVAVLCAVLYAVLALAVVADVVRAQGSADSASFVPDDNRGFQFDIADGPENDTHPGAADTLAIACGFYDRDGGAGEKRVIVYRETPSGKLLGLPARTRWSIAAECVIPNGSAGGGAAAIPNVGARMPRVVMRSPRTVTLVPAALGPRRRNAVLIVAWVRRPNGHWAQLERYSVLRQQGGVMYQFGDFRVACCLDGASAYVVRRRATVMSSTTTARRRPGTGRPLLPRQETRNTIAWVTVGGSFWLMSRALRTFVRNLRAAHAAR